jgi:hypothetical protein
MKYNRSWKFAALANELRTFPSLFLSLFPQEVHLLSNVLGFWVYLIWAIM